MIKAGILALVLPLMLCGPAHAQQDATRTQALEIYRTLVNMDTSTEGRRTPEAARYLASLFHASGFPEADIHVLPLGETAAFVVRYRGDGSGGRPIILMGHLDVVTAHRADWQRDPFTLVEENGYFFGRGSVDNKGDVAPMAATLLALKREGFTPTRDIIFLLTGDEETTGATARMLLTQHRDLIDAEYALNGDAGQGVLDDTTGAPISYSLQAAEKTFASFTLTARNPGGHSSNPRPDNAIYDVAEALQRVRAYEFPVMWNDATLAYFRASVPSVDPSLRAAMARFASRPGDRRAARTLSADPFQVCRVRTTCIPTLLQAGHADNALPQSAVATINCRIFPGVSIAAVQAQLQQLAGARIEVAQLEDFYLASDASPLRDDITAAVTAAVHASYPGVPITPDMALGATDGVFFRAAGIPTYGVASYFIKDSDDYTHGLNERLQTDVFYNGLTHWRVLITELTGRD